MSYSRVSSGHLYVSGIFYAQNRVTRGHYVLLLVQPLVLGTKSEAMEVGVYVFWREKKIF